MSNLNKEIVNEILERIKGDFLKEIRENNVELNIKPLRHAKLLDREEISLTESKVGGFPYIPIGERAPMFYDEFSDCEVMRMRMKMEMKQWLCLLKLIVRI